MKKPNLFNFATSELSQDAFICWLLSWAKPEYREFNYALNDCAIDILKIFFDKHGKPFPEGIKSIDISKQDKNIDVLCVVNREYSLIIEDKTHTSQHSGQLKRYFDEVLHRGCDEEKILPIYFKTRDQSDYKSVVNNGYFPFLRRDLLMVLNKHEDIESDIFQDFRSRMNSIEASIQSFLDLPLGDWQRQSRDIWIGFYMALQGEFPDAGWGYVANQSGGFMCFSFSWQGAAYLQLEQDKLCFKIDVKERRNRAHQRWAWHNAFMAAAKSAGLKLRKPHRFGTGSTMTVCLLDEEYRKVKNGVLDMPETVRFIKKISDFMKTVPSPE